MTDLKYLRLSASQIDTANTCLRKWFLGKILKCPQPFDKKMLLGEVGHGVCENHLQAKPLYPDGWTSPTNRWTGETGKHYITTTEQALVKALITTAIAEGVLLAHPDTAVELEFKPKGVTTVEGIRIDLLGFVDHYYGNVIEDHKFIGANSPRYYGVTKLEKAIAMNLYAKAMYDGGYITDPTCWLRYNLFVKDTSKPRIIKVEVERTKEEIYEYYEEKIVPAFRPMVLAAKNCTEWSQVTSAMCEGRAKQACEKFGGCEYMDICLGKVTVKQYKARFAEVSIEDKKAGQASILETLTNPDKSTPKPEQKEKHMSSGLLQQLKKKEAPAAAKPEGKKEAVKEAAPAVPAPWALDNCPACKGSKSPVAGTNDKGEPCNICVLTTNEMRNTDPQQPVLDDYDVAVSDEGVVIWTAKATEKVVVETAVVEEPPVVKEVVDAKGGSEFDEEPEPVGQEQVAKAPKEKAVKENINMERTGTQGFMISYVPVRNKKRSSKKLGESNCVVHIHELLEHICGKLLEVANSQGASAKEWYDIDAFKRRDMIHRNGKELAELVGNSTVEVSNVVKASDAHTLASAIERYASVICGSWDN